MTFSHHLVKMKDRKTFFAVLLQENSLALGQRHLNQLKDFCDALLKSVQIRSFSCPYFPVFGLNTSKYGHEKNSYLDTFHAVMHHTITS